MDADAVLLVCPRLSLMLAVTDVLPETTSDVTAGDEVELCPFAVIAVAARVAPYFREFVSATRILDLVAT